MFAQITTTRPPFAPSLMPQYSYRALGKRLRELREQLRIERTDTAARVGLSVESVRSMESGRWRAGTEVLRKLAALYGVDYNELAELAGYYVRPATQPWVPPADKAPWLRRIAQLPTNLVVLLADMGERLAGPSGMEAVEPLTGPDEAASSGAPADEPTG